LCFCYWLGFYKDGPTFDRTIGCCERRLSRSSRTNPFPAVADPGVGQRNHERRYHIPNSASGPPGITGLDSRIYSAPGIRSAQRRRRTRASALARHSNSSFLGLPILW
jgi:hypothetical protein